MTYLDANATEPLRPQARAAMLAALDVVGNPASVHAAGRAARRVLEESRERIAARFGARAEEVVFTAGGTEADALAVHGLGAGRRLIVGATEHDAVRAAAAGAAVLPVDADGVADLAALERLLAGGPALVCLMLANNETGVLHPVAEAAALCQRAGALLHVDAVQAAGRMAVSLAALGADSLAVTSHKLGGPGGAGALLLAPGRELMPLIRGGGQERGRRGGTPPVAAIAGFAAAAMAGPAALARLRDGGGGGPACGARWPARAARLGNTASLWCCPGRGRRRRVIALDLAGVRARPGRRAPRARWRGRTCWRRWGWGRGRARRSGCRCRGTRRRPTWRHSPAHTGPWPRACCTTPHSAYLHCMDTRPNRPIYLDNQATTACDPRVVAAMLPFFTERYGNPHSAEHAMGRDAEDAVEAARAEIAAVIGAEAREIVLTSGATESNNIAIKGAARFAAAQGDPRRRVVTVATEHKCVLESVGDLAAEGFEPVILPVGADGLLDPGALRDALAVPTLLVSVMAVNNETGVVQDLAGLAAIAKAGGALFHTDAAQGFGKIAIDVNAMRIDLLSVSGHKIYGPKGVGALYVRRRPRVRLVPLFSGGGQERGLRSGTLPAPLIVGLGEAARIARAEMADDSARIAGLRDLLLARLEAGLPGLAVNASRDRRIPGNLNLTFPAASAQDMLKAMPELCVSTGSACTSAEIEPSHVLRAIGLSEDAAGRTLRIGIGRFTSAAEIETAAAMLVAAHAAATGS